MILKQYYLGCLAHASYLIADEETGSAVIVDPQRDIQQYLDDARDLNLQVRATFLTHLHADFVAGHIELRERTGARIYLGAQALAKFEHTPLHEGDVLEFGKVRLKILETPGHTPEHISILVYDLARSETHPHAVLTGDTLFVGDVGRPDLLGAVGLDARSLARLLHASLRKLLQLPDDTLVYPAHGAGSLCGRNLGAETHTTIGEQRRSNYALQPMPRETFVDTVLADQPEPPAYFIHDRLMNTGERKTLEENLRRAMKPLSPELALRLVNAGAAVVDTRDPAAYAAAHMAGSLNLGLGGQYATWAGTLLHRDRLLVLVADPGREYESAMRLGRIGFDHVAGYLDGGMAALTALPDLVEASERIDAAQLARELEGTAPPVVLDVRTPGEFRAGHIGGALHVPLNRLDERIEEIPRGRRVAVICRTGYRSAIAVSLLRAHGLRDLADVAGGMAAWQARGAEGRVA